MPDWVSITDSVSFFPMVLRAFECSSFFEKGVYTQTARQHKKPMLDVS